jgi:hypothetical protein
MHSCTGGMRIHGECLACVRMCMRRCSPGTRMERPIAGGQDSRFAQEARSWCGPCMVKCDPHAVPFPVLSDCSWAVVFQEI